MPLHPVRRCSPCALASLCTASPSTASVLPAPSSFLAWQLDAHKQFRERLGAALLLDEILAVGEEVCEAEEQQLQAAPEAMRQRCDTEGCERVSWYRRHRPYASSVVPFKKDEKPAPEATVSLVEIHARSLGKFGADGNPGL